MEDNNYNPQKEDLYTKFPFLNTKHNYVKIIAIVLAVVLTLSLVVGVGIGCYFAGMKTQFQSNINKELALADEVYDLINRYYYKDISKDEFNKYAALGLSSVMDQYSGLSLKYSPETTKIGIHIISDSYNNHIISNVSIGSPAYNAVGTFVDENGVSTGSSTSAKMQRGDLLYSINGVIFQGLSIDKLNDLQLLGKGRAEIIVKKSNDSYAKFDIAKTIFESKQAHYEDFGNGIGYIKLDSFTGSAAEDFVACANLFAKGSNEKLILDLRDNGGGSSDILETIGSYILHDSRGNSDDLPIIRLKMQKTGEVVTYNTKGNNWLGKNKTNYQLVVLINGGSASASEALLGAIKYYCKEAIIIGSESYGKGIAQQTFELKNGPYYLSMTVGNFYVPTQGAEGIKWTTFHGKPMRVTDGFDVGALSGYDYSKNYKNYYNNVLKNEIAVSRAIDYLSK